MKASRNKAFHRVRNLQPPRSFFNLSYEKKFDCDMGQLIPVMCDEVVPGDLIKLGCQSVVRFNPMVAPILHEVNQYVHYFFVPYRLLWNQETNEALEEEGDWESFITGGVDGENADVLPRWDYSGAVAYSLADYFGLPLITNLGTYTPLDFIRRAYNFVYNEYYRDQNLIDPVAWDNDTVLRRCWEKDYFTSSLPFQQRGIAPALPINGTTSAIWDVANFSALARSSSSSIDGPELGSTPNDVWYAGNANGQANMRAFMNANTIDLSVASTFDIADLRLAFQVQKWMERNARAGVRYTEFLKAHFGVSPRDERLNRPEYIGGSKTPIIISEVLQTSETGTSPQGNLAGHGIGINQNYCGKYHATEYGVIIGIMSIMPRSLYQQGINRQWRRQTRYDFYFPEFCNLSEQAIENGELFVTENNDAVNEDVFGYQGRYDEMRTKQNMVVAGMRDTFDYWHISRQFSSVPTLNDTFVTCTPRKDCFSVTDVPCCIVSFGNIIHAYRPLPIQAEPGLIDHN